MKVGICTNHYAHNYGAMLQAYALRRYCESKGCDVVMTDRRTKQLPTIKLKSLRGLSWKEILLYPKYFVKWFLPIYLPIERRKRNFNCFLNKYLNDKLLSSKDIELDLIIYGSDQIWSKYDYGFNDRWWGDDGLKARKRITYAASMGVVDITDEDEPYIRNALSRFDAVSVREKDLYDELVARKLYDGEALRQTIDPTFLISVDEWKKIAASRMIKEPYLLFYDFQIDAETTRIVKKIAQSRNLKIVRMTDGLHVDNEDAVYIETAGPSEFLSLIYYADFVFSSSFHGTAFSIIFKKQFAVRQIWNKERVKSLLAIAELSERFIEGAYREGMLCDINYGALSSLEKKILESKEFLDKAIID